MFLKMNTIMFILLLCLCSGAFTESVKNVSNPYDFFGNNSLLEAEAVEAEENVANIALASFLSKASNDKTKHISEFTDSQTGLNPFIDLDEGFPMNDRSQKPFKIPPIFDIFNVTPTFWSNEKDIVDEEQDEEQDEELLEPIKSKKNPSRILPIILTTPPAVVPPNFHVPSIFETFKELDLDNQLRNQLPVHLQSVSQANSTTLPFLEASAENSAEDSKKNTAENHSESTDIQTAFDDDGMWYTEMEQNEQDDRRKMVFRDNLIISGVIMCCSITFFIIVLIFCAIAHHKHSHMTRIDTESTSSRVPFTSQI